MNDIHQLIKLEGTLYGNVFPKAYVQGITDKNSGKTLDEILSNFNMYFLSYDGDIKNTRLQVPLNIRKKGLWVTYINLKGNVVTEWYNNDSIEDKDWKNSDNWIDGSNMLSGDLAISSEGYWVINGVNTKLPARGKEGITPLLRGFNGKLQVSYNNGESFNYLDLPTFVKEDNEDIKAVIDSNGIKELKFADKTYNPAEFSGLGRVILRKNIVQGKNILTQEMINKPNTVYEIRYDFDLNGREITILEECVLDFKGGSFKNGKIVLNDTVVESNYKIFNNIVIKGLCKGDFDLKWIGISTNNSSNGIILKNLYSKLIDIKNISLYESIDVEINNIQLPNKINFNAHYNTINFTSTISESCIILSNSNIIQNIKLQVKKEFTGNVLEINTSKRLLNTKIEKFKLNNIKINSEWSSLNDYNCTALKIISTNNHDIKSDNYLTNCYINNCNFSLVKNGIICENINVNDETSKNFSWLNAIFGLNTYISCIDKAISFINKDDGVNNPANSVGYCNFTNTEIQALDGITKKPKIVLNNFDVGFSGSFQVWDNYGINGEITNCTVTLERVDMLSDNSINDDYIANHGFIIKNKGRVNCINQPVNKFLINNNYKKDYSDYTTRWIYASRNYSGFADMNDWGNNMFVAMDDKYLAFKHSMHNVNSTEYGLFQVEYFKRNAYDLFHGDGTLLYRHRPTVIFDNSYVKKISTYLRNDRVISIDYNYLHQNGNFDNKIKRVHLRIKLLLNQINFFDTYKCTQALILNYAITNFNNPSSTSICCRYDTTNKELDITFDYLNENWNGVHIDVLLKSDNQFNFHYKNDSHPAGSNNFQIDVLNPLDMMPDNVEVVESVDYDLVGDKRNPKPYNGFEMYDTSINKYIYWNGNMWVDKNNNPINALKKGTTSQRPTGVQIGFIYKDTDLNKWIIWNGEAWENIDGTALG